MLKKFLPQEIDFFSMFENAALNLNKSAQLLVDMMEDLSTADGKAKEIHDAEQAGDMLTHEVMRKLNKTFLTPVDREDIHALVCRIDDVTDLIWASADRTILFKLRNAPPEAIDLCKTLHENTEIITKALGCLK